MNAMSAGLKEVIKQHPTYFYKDVEHEQHGQLMLFFLFHTGDASVGVDPHVEHSFVTDMDGVLQEHLSTEEVCQLEEQIS